MKYKTFKIMPFKMGYFNPKCLKNIKALSTVYNNEGYCTNAFNPDICFGETEQEVMKEIDNFIIQIMKSNNCSEKVAIQLIKDIK
jgi:hypothetical protein